MTSVIPFSLDVFKTTSRREVPWLVLGKGPSFVKYRAELNESHRVVALNHAMRGITVQLGHTLDIEVLEQMNAEMLSGVEFLCLPWIPHTRQARPFMKGKAFFGPGRLNLEQYCERIPVLQDFLQRGRLLSYNFCSASEAQRNPALPEVEGYTFSAAVVIRMLAQAGAMQIRTLGVDGGASYSVHFKDIEDTTKLQTAQPSFDIQFEEIAGTILKHQLDFGPLDVDLPARVFVGCMPEQDLAFQVLAYSIQKHASLSVEILRLHDCIVRQSVHIPVPAKPENRGKTPFSFQRFAIPALCGFKGRAIYLDSDMLVLRDLRTLWMADMQQQQMLSVESAPGTNRAPQFSVMLMDTGSLMWNVADLVTQLDNGIWNYSQLMHEMACVERWSPSLPAIWNSLEHYEPGKTCLVHFTDMDGQPWLNPFHANATLWTRYLLDAIKDGHIRRETVEDEIRRGHVRPSLLAQIDRDDANPKNLPFAVLRRDLSEFFPPHRKQTQALSRFKHELHRFRNLLVHQFRQCLWRPVTQPLRRAASALLSAVSR